MALCNLRVVLLLIVIAALGCGGDPAAALEDVRKSAYASYSDGLNAFNQKDYATAESKIAAALAAKGLNPDVYCEATAKYAVCLAAAGKYAEAVSQLDSLGPAAPNQAEIFAARSFILKKQGKVAEANIALTQAKRLDRMIKEF